MDLTKLPIAELQEQLRKRAVTAREIAEAHLKRIDERDPQVKAFPESESRAGAGAGGRH